MIGVERLWDEDEAPVCAGLQSCGIVRVAAWVDHIAFKRLGLFINLCRLKLDGSFVER